MQHGAAMPWLLNGCRSVAIGVAVDIEVVVEVGIPVHPAALGLVLLIAWVSPVVVIVVNVESLVATGVRLSDVLALLPGVPLIAGHPEVIGIVVIHFWGVPPTAFIGAVVDLVVHVGARFVHPFTTAVDADLGVGLNGDGGSGGSEDSKGEFHRYFVCFIYYKFQSFRAF